MSNRRRVRNRFGLLAEARETSEKERRASFLYGTKPPPRRFPSQNLERTKNAEGQKNEQSAAARRSNGPLLSSARTHSINRTKQKGTWYIKRF